MRTKLINELKRVSLPYIESLENIDGAVDELADAYLAVARSNIGTARNSINIAIGLLEGKFDVKEYSDYFMEKYAGEY